MKIYIKRDFFDEFNLIVEINKGLLISSLFNLINSLIKDETFTSIINRKIFPFKTAEYSCFT
jgi:hypothetical protein